MEPSSSARNGMWAAPFAPPSDSLACVLCLSRAMPVIRTKSVYPHQIPRPSRAWFPVPVRRRRMRVVLRHRRACQSTMEIRPKVLRMVRMLESAHRIHLVPKFAFPRGRITKQMDGDVDVFFAPPKTEEYTSKWMWMCTSILSVRGTWKLPTNHSDEASAHLEYFIFATN